MSFIQNRHILLNPLFLIGYFGLILLCYFFPDRPVASFFHTVSLPHYVYETVRFLSALALSWYYLIGLPIAAFISLEVFKNVRIARACVFIWLAVIFSSVCCGVLKMILTRARPDMMFDVQDYGFFYWHMLRSSYWSFPSGHATTIISLMTALSYLKPRLTWLFMVIALVISAMRIILFQHYISDILAAFYLSFLCVNFLYTFYQKKGYNLPKF